MIGSTKSMKVPNLREDATGTFSEYTIDIIQY